MDGPAPPSPSVGVAHQIPDRLRTLGGIALVVAVSVAIVRLGFYLSFVSFNAYDDEGYLLLSLVGVDTGHALYDEVFSQYGPFYYLAVGWLSKLPGLGLTTDGLRLLWLGLWVMSSVVAGMVAWRWARSWLLTAAVTLLFFLGTVGTVQEPGHPQGLLTLLLAIALAIVAGRPTSTPAWVFLGAIAGAAALVKLNVGAFIGLGIAIGATTGESRRWARHLNGLGLAAGVVLAPILMLQHLGQGWARHYASVVAITMLATAAVVRGGFRPSKVSRPGRLIAVGCGAAMIALPAVLWSVFVASASITGLVDAVLVRRLAHATVFWLPPPLHGFGPAWAVANLGIATAWALGSTGRRADVVRWLVLVWRAAAAGALWWWMHVDRFGLLSLGIPLLWMVAAAPPSAEVPERRARATMAATITLWALVAYPVSGSHFFAATAPLAMVAAVLTSDCFAELRRLAPQPAARLMPSGAIRLAAGATLVAVAIPWYASGLSIQAASQRWHENVSLRLPGAELVRLPADEAGLWRWLASTLRTHCSTFVAMPGLNSLYPWSGLDPPTMLNTGTWMTLLDDDEQIRIRDALDASPRPCVVLQPDIADYWVKGRDVADRPLMRHLGIGWVPRSSHGGFVIATPASDSDPWPVSVVARPLAFRGLVSEAVAGPESVLLPERFVALRVEFRTSIDGSLVSRQDIDRLRPPARASVMMSVGGDGRLRAGFGLTAALASPSPVDDGVWHTAELQLTTAGERLLVDGVTVADRPGPVPTDPRERYILIGVGWDDGADGAPTGWVPFRGEIRRVDVVRTPDPEPQAP